MSIDEKAKSGRDERSVGAITQTRRTLEALRDSEERFRAFFEISSVGMCEAEPYTGKLLQINRRFCEMTGYSEAELLGRGFSEITHPEDRDSNSNDFVRLCQGEIAHYRVQKRYVRKDGGIIWADVTVNVVRDAEGEPVHVVAVVQDITEGRAAEDALRESEERFRMATDAISGLIYEWNVATGKVERSRGMVNIVGYEPHEVPATAAWWAERVHPGDIAQAHGIYHAFARRAPSYATEYRVRRRDHRWIWVWDQSRIVYGEDGQPLRVVGCTVSIDERKRAETALRESEERFRQLADAMPQLVWTAGSDAIVDYYNARMAEYGGIVRDADGVWKWEPVVHEEDFQPTLAAWRAAVKHGEIYQFEHRLRMADGSYRWHLSRALPVRDKAGAIIKWFGTATDIHGQKQAVAALHDSEERLQLALDGGRMGMWEWNAHTDRSIWNAREFQLLGLQPSDAPVSGSLFFKHMHPADVARVRAQLELCMATGADFESEFRILRADNGEVRWLAGVGQVKRDAADNPLLIVGVNYDITERKRLEKELEQHVEVLKEADRRKDEFIATLAHELRNPLAPIRNAIELFRLCKPGEVDFEWGRDLIDHQISHMVRLLEDLLDVSRITRNKLELRQEKVSLGEVVDAAVQATRSVMEQRGHRLTVTTPAEPIELTADPVRLTQLLVNLLNNAAKYTPQGGCIELVAERDGASAFVRVKDNGIGITPEKLPFIFGMFYQGDRSYEQAHGGLGIGLTLVKRLAEMHGGSVEARSAGTNQGSEFIVRLPVILKENSAAGEQGVREGVTALSRRILIVDDYPNAAESLARWLRRMGNEVYTALDGIEAVEAAERLRPDIVLLDIAMPKLNGYEAAERIRAHAWGKQMVLVALTGWGQAEDRQRTQAAGFRMHLIKPVDHTQLEALLGSLVE